MQAITSVRAACNMHRGWKHALSVVDVFAEPALTEQYRVIATPTLISVGPSLERRWVGDVSKLSECLSEQAASEPAGAVGDPSPEDQHDR